MQKNLLAVGILMAAIIGLGMVIPSQVEPVEPNDDHGPLKTYQNDQYGIQFQYPETYVVEEHTSEDRFDVVLIDKDDYAELQASVEPREGPPSITISVFQNDTGKQSVAQWVESSPFSSWNLSSGTYSSMTVAGLPAIYYTWDGLYRGDTIAFVSGDNAFTASVTSLDAADSIRHDFDHLTQTLLVTQPQN